MNCTPWIIFVTAFTLLGCGELMFGPSETYALGSSSCIPLEKTCGAEQNEDCCLSPIVGRASIEEEAWGQEPPSISDFRLDQFEVTVGRFRAFVNRYPQSKPQSEHGTHPRIPLSGWNAEWDAMLPVDRDDLKLQLRCGAGLSTWSDTPANRESLPINCVDWYLAFAFCAWDGGRLPTEAEWLYAARGPENDRTLPWSDSYIDSTHALYDCLGDGSDRWQCALTDILAVGSRSPDGDGFFGQADLAGSMREWMLDAFQANTPNPCRDCAVLPAEPLPRVLHGGGWDLGEDLLLNSTRQKASPEFRFHDIGFRCARDL